jgi:hypothetical protein
MLSYNSLGSSYDGLGGEALFLQGNAEKSMMIMVGDVLKKTSAISGDAMWDVDDFVRAMYSSIILC